MFSVFVRFGAAAGVSTEIGVDCLGKEALGAGPLPVVWRRVGCEGFSWLGGALKGAT